MRRRVFFFPFSMDRSESGSYENPFHSVRRYASRRCARLVRELRAEEVDEFDSAQVQAQELIKLLSA